MWEQGDPQEQFPEAGAEQSLGAVPGSTLTTPTGSTERSHYTTPTHERASVRSGIELEQPISRTLAAYQMRTALPPDDSFVQYPDRGKEHRRCRIALRSGRGTSCSPRSRPQAGLTGQRPLGAYLRSRWPSTGQALPHPSEGRSCAPG